MGASFRLAKSIHFAIGILLGFCAPYALAAGYESSNSEHRTTSPTVTYGDDGAQTGGGTYSGATVQQNKPLPNLNESLSTGSRVIRYTAGSLLNPDLDSDGDNVPDSSDECDTTPGLAPHGCPDADRDGFKDTADACPQDPGVAPNGCPPDSDGDGVNDNIDQCDATAGPASNNGCPIVSPPPPDADGDGISDDTDLCPSQPGPASTGGCPDTDGDGVPNSTDLCPTQAGPASAQGCPDSDLDGVPNNGTDLCPTQAGPASNNGCPVSTGSGPFTSAPQKVNGLGSGAGDFYGFDVSLSSNGGLFIVGSHVDSDLALQNGSAYANSWSGSAYNQESKLVAPDAAAYDNFGSAVAISSDGSTLAVFSSIDNQESRPQLYVYRRSGSNWIYSTTLKGCDNHGVGFRRNAISIADAGNYIAVGCPSDNGATLAVGVARIYHFNGTVWSLQSTLQYPETNPSNKYFGHTVAISGDASRVAVSYTANSDANRYRVDVFVRSGSSWSFEQQMGTHADSVAPNVIVPLDMNTDGSVLVAGYPSTSFPSLTNAGSVVVFRRSGSSWTAGARIRTPSYEAAYGNFGREVALNGAGTSFAVARHYATPGDLVYVFDFNGSSWNAVSSFLPPADAPVADHDEFGASLDMSSDGRVLAVGSPMDDDLGTDSGSVYVFRR